MPFSIARMVAASAAILLPLAALAWWAQTRLGASLLPHSFCITSSQPLLWLHVVSDTLIAFAYLSIPLSLVHVVRHRSDIPFGWLALLFGAFIVFCGLSHIVEVWTLWDPVYWYSGVIKAVTAAASLGTAWVLIQRMPQILALPSTGQLRAMNAALEREVASRRQAEAALKALVARSTAQAERASAMLDRFFDSAPLGLVVFDEQLRFVRINAALAASNGMPADAHVGQPLEALAPRLDPRVLETVRQVAATREPLADVEVAGPDARGDRRHWRLHYFPIALPSGGLLVGGIVQDITWQRAIERERADALAAAEQANRMKDVFLARVSHELRSPLQVALSGTEALRRLPGLPAAAERVVGRLGASVAQQARMVSDLLDVSRILSGKLHVEPRATDPAAPLAEALEHWQELAAQRRITLDATGLSTGQATVQADPARLVQVYTNLLDNALRFTAEGGTVRLRAEVLQAHWRLAVQDDGVGLAAGELRAIFEPFSQVDPVAGGRKGLGLGLAIVHSLVQAFGGRVWAESAGRGLGSTFHVELPLWRGGAGGPVPRADEATDAVATRLDGVQMLYVEDDPDVATAMCAGLEAAGATVHLAADGPQALRLLAAQRLDAIVSDLNLGPGMSGFDVMRAARALPQLAQVPAVAVSAYGSEEDRRLTQAAGFDRHIVKPASVEAVARAVRQLLDRPPPAARPAPADPS